MIVSVMELYNICEIEETPSTFQKCHIRIASYIDVLDKSYCGGDFRPLKLDIDLLRTAKIHYSLIFGRWLAQKP